MRQHRLLEAGFLILLPVIALPTLLFMLSRDEGSFSYPEVPERTLRVVIASPQHQGIKTEFEEGFKRWLYRNYGLGVDVIWLDHGGGTKTLRWIEERFKQNPSGVGVDVLFGGGTDPYETLKAHELMYHYDPAPEVLDGVALEIGGFPVIDPDHYWFGTAFTGFGIMNNREVFSRVPLLQGMEIETWDDLTDPRLKGWVGAADPRNSSSYHTFYEILLQSSETFQKGMDLARLMAGNVSAFNKYSIQIPQLCAVGQVATAPSIDQYVAAQIEKVGDAIVFVLPVGKTLVNTDAAGILKGAPNPEAAEFFIDFLLSRDAGLLWMLRVGEPGGPVRQPLVRASVRPALYEEVAGRSDVRNNPFEFLQEFDYDYDTASVRWNILNDLLGALLIDNHEDLVEAVAVYHGLPDRERKDAEVRLFALPVTEEELSSLAQGPWNDVSIREQKRMEWTEFARRNYRAVVEMGGEVK